jgi:hypothetical protein
LENTDNQATGQLGISLVNTSGGSNTSTIGGALVMIVFDVNANAAIGPTPIDLVPSNTPGSLTVTTGLTAKNPSYSMAPRPLPTNGFVTGVDGIVTIQQVQFVVSAPSPVTAGTGFQFTVTAVLGNTTDPAYTGTVAFSSSDTNATLPASSSLSNGVGTFSATLITAGSQTITATDTVNSSLTGFSNTITVSAAALTHLGITVPSTAVAGSAFGSTTQSRRTTAR